jgi:hypothetical protein
MAFVSFNPGASALGLSRLAFHTHMFHGNRLAFLGTRLAFHGTRLGFTAMTHDFFDFARSRMAFVSFNPCASAFGFHRTGLGSHLSRVKDKNFFLFFYSNGLKKNYYSE